MKLTEEQQRVVTENHDLVYWYLNLKGLPIDEWYGIMAMELCTTVVKHDPSKASLITYYKIRADHRFHYEWRRSNAKKRIPEEVELKEEHFGEYMVDDVLDNLDILDDLDELEKDVVVLMYKGYSQKEISELIGVHQSNVSRKLKKVREKYGKNHR